MHVCLQNGMHSRCQQSMAKHDAGATAVCEAHEVGTAGRAGSSAQPAVLTAQGRSPSCRISACRPSTESRSPCAPAARISMP